MHTPAVPQPTSNPRAGREIAVFPLAVVVCLAAVAMGLVNADFGRPAVPHALPATVSLSAPGRALPSRFLGLSTEYWAVERYAGSDPSALDPVFEQLVRNLSPGGGPLLRIGGDSADHTWWPVPGMARPPGVSYALDDNWLSVTRSLSSDLGARLILGLNLEADSAQLASSELAALSSGLDPAPVEGFELGNEPSLYPIFPWYRAPSGKNITGRRPGYDFAAYLHDFANIAAQLPTHALAGPAFGGPGWLPDLGRFLDAQPQVRIAAVHRYPLQLCLTPQSSPRYPTVAHLLAPAASTGLAAQFTRAAADAHARHRRLLIDELNTVSCEPDRRVSQSFASALWALDTLFAFARVGVDGVEIHTFPGAGYELFRLRQDAHGWSAAVSPEYYGLLMFQAAAPAGARLVPVSAVPGLRVWATLGRDGRVRVLAINPDPSRDRAASLAIPGASATATVERLIAPSLQANAGVTLAGQSVGASTGKLAGARQVEEVSPVAGRYVLTVPAGSAALMVISG